MTKYLPGLNVCSGKICSGGYELTLPNVTGTLITTSETQTLINKSLSDSTTFIIDEGDATKRAQFQVSGITSGQTRTITVPDSDGTLCYIGLTQTLTNKTLTTPVVSSVYQDAGQTKLMTLPDTASDTLCAIAATQTLTNKTLTTPVIASIYQDAGKTKLMTLPDTASDTLVSLAATQTLTNKTLGTVQYGYTSVTASTTLGAHNLVRCNGLAAECKLTLPDAATNAGKMYTIIREDATYNVVVERAGSDTIGDASTTSITLSTNYSTMTIFSGGGTVWYCV